MFWKVQNDLEMQTLSLQKKKRKKKCKSVLYSIIILILPFLARQTYSSPYRFA